MPNNVDERVRVSLSGLAETVNVERPALAVLEARAVRTRGRRRRRTVLVVAPLAAIAAAGAAVAATAGGAPSVARQQLDVAKQWSPVWDIPASNIAMVASATAADGTKAQYWRGISATSPNARCYVLLEQFAGQPWRSTGQDCRSGRNSLPDPDSLVVGGAFGQNQDSILIFNTPSAATRVVLRFADGSTSTLKITTSGYALAIQPPGANPISATALDREGRPLATTAITEAPSMHKTASEPAVG